MTWHVYMLECADGTIYCGSTTDVKRRIGEHNSGTGCKYTRTRRPVRLIASWDAVDMSHAYQMERFLKKLRREVKISFSQIQNKNNQL